MSTAPLAIGIFGFGLIGSRIAERLRDAGHSVHLFDPAEERRQAAEAAGFHAHSSPEALLCVCARLVLAVFDTAQVEAVVRVAARSALPGGHRRRLVVTSTCDPDHLSRLAAEADAQAIDLIEAPISGSSGELAAGEATLLVAGDAEAVEACSDLLQAISPKIVRLGPVGEGNRAKLAVNLILGLNRAALAEGLVFAQALGLDPAAFLAIARNSAAFSQVMAVKGEAMAARDFAPRGRMRQSAKDFDLIAASAHAGGLRLPLTQGYRDLVSDCLRHGEGELDNAAIILAVERAAGAAAAGLAKNPSDLARIP